MVPNRQGTALTAYTGPDAGSLTVGGELNKVAANIAMGRSFAGIHWRTDYSESLKMGEEVAIGILEEQQATYNESGSFTPPPIRYMRSGQPGQAQGIAWACPYFQGGHAWFEW